MLRPALELQRLGLPTTTPLASAAWESSGQLFSARSPPDKGYNQHLTIPKKQKKYPYQFATDLLKMSVIILVVVVRTAVGSLLMVAMLRLAA